MEALELKAEIRQTTGKHVKHLRREGLIPAVVYGAGFEPTLIQIPEKTLNKVLGQAGTHQLISLQIGNKPPHMTVARDIQRDVIKRNYLHVDFYAVTMDHKLTAQVPFEFVGVSPAVKEAGGILIHGLDQVEIECLPQDLIPAIVVNLETLVDLNDTITVADLKLPGSITILSDPESMIAKIEPPRKAEELAEELVVAGAEPEVLTEAKEKEKESNQEK